MLSKFGWERAGISPRISGQAGSGLHIHRGACSALWQLQIFKAAQAAALTAESVCFVAAPIVSRIFLKEL